MSTLHVPRERLPVDDRLRDASLCDYFCERVAVSTPTADGWAIDVTTAPSIEFYVDPRLAEGLAWWDRSLPINDIPLARHADLGWLLSLNDAWTAHAWSEAFSSLGEVPDQLVVLHVDDHSDLMTPRVRVQDGDMTDLISGAALDFTRPETVEAAIVSGALAQGSFMAPLLHISRKVEVRHLCQRYIERQGRWELAPVLERDTLLALDADRPAVDIRTGDRAPSIYHLTDDLDRWVAELPDGPILLHVDFDYFNNRFDGDSDWRARTRRHDPPVDAVLERIHDTIEAVSRLDRPIAAVSAALSPGFFPAEMWAPAVDAFATAASTLRVDS